MNDIYLFDTPYKREMIRKAAKFAAGALYETCAQVKPGVSTWDLDQFAEQWIKDRGGVPTFKGYGGLPSSMPFPATLCTSVNHEVVHGIPSKSKILRAGDIISIDVGVTLSAEVDGKVVQFVGDNACTVCVGEASASAKKLIADIKRALMLGIEQCRPGRKISDIARAIEAISDAEGYGSVREFGGHGICPNYHGAPFIPNYMEYFRSAPDCVIQEGMVLAIEPMFNLGLSDIRKLKDDWTIVTKDNKLSAHYEHSVLVTANGPEIITIWDGQI